MKEGRKEGRKEERKVGRKKGRKEGRKEQANKGTGREITKFPGLPCKYVFGKYY